MESDGAMTDPTTAAADLAALQAGRAAMADRAMQPWWYDALLGLLLFGFLSSYSAHETWVTVVALVVFVGGCLALASVYKRITGFWVSGFRPGPAQRAVRVWLVGYVLVLAVAGGLEFGLGWRGAMVAGGAVLGVGVALMSRWWTRLYIAELRSQL
jgi:hypothetical protein